MGTCQSWQWDWEAACVSRLSHAEGCVLFLLTGPAAIFAWQNRLVLPLSPIVCLSVCPSLPPPSCSSRVALVGKKRIKISTWKLCRAVGSGQQTGACYAEHGAVCWASRYSLSCSCQGWLCTGERTCTRGRGGNNATRARKGWQANGRSSHTAPEWDLLSSLPARQWELQRGTGHLHCSVPLAGLSLLSCSVSRVILALIQL